MYKIIFFLIFISLLSCKNDAEQQIHKTDPVLEKIAGKNYADLIEIPTKPNGMVDEEAMARIVFDSPEYLFDTIFSGDIINHTFEFRNEGKKDLYILETNTSCGCTVPSYSKEAIAPGARGEIQVSFNSKSKSGKQFRRISVITNSYPAEKVISFKGFVKQMKKD